MLQTQISEIKNEVTRAEREIISVVQKKRGVQSELQDVKEEFADFIKRVQPYNDTNADFVVPPALSPYEYDAS